MTAVPPNPMAIHSDTKIGINGMVSSAIPNTDPQMENRTIIIGMIIIDLSFSAQGIAGLPPLSAMGFRVVLYICFVLLAVTFVMRYALKIKKNPYHRR